MKTTIGRRPVEPAIMTELRKEHRDSVWSMLSNPNRAHVVKVAHEIRTDRDYDSEAERIEMAYVQGSIDQATFSRTDSVLGRVVRFFRR